MTKKRITELEKNIQIFAWTVVILFIIIIALSIVYNIEKSNLKSQLQLSQIYEEKIFENVPDRCIEWGEWEYNNNSKSKSCLRIINRGDIRCEVIPKKEVILCKGEETDSPTGNMTWSNCEVRK